VNDIGTCGFQDDVPKVVEVKKRLD